MAERLFEVNGEQLDVPLPETLDFDEWEFVYDLTGYTLRNFVIDEDESPEAIAEFEERLDRQAHNPRFQRALVAIAYVREHRDEQLAATYDRLGGVTLLEVFAISEDDEAETPEGEPSPPDEEGSTSEPSEKSDDASSESNENSGSESKITSDEQVEPLESIGATR